jgi:hypothetical protein
MLEIMSEPRRDNFGWLRSLRIRLRYLVRRILNPGACSRFLLLRIERTAIFLTWYVLSIGPMFWYWHHGVHSHQPSWIETFYRPLVYACDRWPLLGKVVNAYVDLWIL